MKPMSLRTHLAAGCMLALVAAFSSPAAAQNGPNVQPLARTAQASPKGAQPIVFPTVPGPGAAAGEFRPAVGPDTRIIKIAASPNAPPQHLALAVNKAAIIELDADARDVFVANPQIVDAVVRTPRRIFLMSLKVGQTNVILLDAAGKHIATLEVDAGSDVAELNIQFAREMPNARVRAEPLNDNIVLSGTVNSVTEASFAQEMATRLTGDPLKVVNRLNIGQRQQVLIKVRVSEMSRQIAKQFSNNIQAAIGRSSTGIPFFFGTDNQFNLLGRALANLSGARIGSFGSNSPAEGLTQICSQNGLTNINPVLASDRCYPDPNNVQNILRALEQIGLIHTLAEPNLTAVSGESAKFLAGGEFPVPTQRDLYGNVLITFKQFGVGLAFTPIVLGGGRISLQISTEVSELSTQGAFLISSGVQGLQVPGLTVRRAETTVELPSGGSLAIGGLLQQQSKQVLAAFPGLKDLPVLGALFRSRDFQNNETELVVMVTAYLVDPVQEAKLTTPDSGYALPTDVETMLLGRVSAVYGKDARLPPDVPKNAIGYIVQ